MPTPPHIGTLREKPLHAALKHRYAQTGDRAEVRVGGYVVDLVRDDLLIEIQTVGFSSMKRKLPALLEDHAVRLVHPIPREKWLVKLDPSGGEPERRRSPKRGTPHDLFAELVSFPELVAHPRLSIDVLMITEEEIRRFDGRRGRRRNGWVVEERRLLDIEEIIRIESEEDLLDLVPDSLPDPFTTADLAKALKRPRRLAQQMTYCLRHIGLIDMVGKRGHAMLYAVTTQPAATGPS